jgi:hypothetical protein
MDLKDLQDCKKGQDCYILACGPSLNKYDNQETREKLRNNLVLSVKQAYDKFKKETDFHFWNCSNLPVDYKNIPYRYITDKPEVVVASSNYPLGARWNPEQHHDIFFRVPLLEEIGGKEKTLAYKKNYNDYLISKTCTERRTGPGIMLETVFYTAIHIGVRSITTIGWDLDKYNNHFYEGKQEISNKACEIPWDMKLNAEAVPSIKEWIESKGIKIEVLK